MKKYRLGIDMGSTSLGWCALELNEDKEPIDILRMGVRIFDDGRDNKSKEPLAVTRRVKRSMRRNHDRYLMRREELLKTLKKNGLMSNNESEIQELIKLDPYELRTKALHDKLTLHEIGRAIFHLSKRRGFKSNRKLDRNDKETGPTKAAISNLKDKLKDYRADTIGEYLYSLNAGLNKSQHIKKCSLRFHAGETEKDIFPDRELIEDEFDKIWEKQAEYHTTMTQELHDKIKDIIFYQRPLKAQPKGLCIFEYKKGEERAMKASPYFQEFRILSEVNNLVLVDMEFNKTLLTSEQRSTIIEMLMKQKTAKFMTIRKKILPKAIYDMYSFNLEDDKRKELNGNATTIDLSNEKAFGKKWFSLPIEKQHEIVMLILNDENDLEVEKNLVNVLQNDYSLSKEQAEYVTNLHLPAGTGNLSIKAIKKILPSLREGLIYSDACNEAGYKHSKPGTGEVFVDGDLPYYGKLMPTKVMFADPNGQLDEEIYGRISNPTVHIALNQLRKLVNQLALEIGAPSQIVLELARDLKLNKKQKDDVSKKQTRERKHNEAIALELEKLGIPNNYTNRLRYKLWEDLNKDPLKRCCPYSGVQIPQHELFSNRFEIEHILPKSRTYDDSFMNKTISLRGANRIKGERSPYEAFGSSPKGYEWDKIIARANEIQSYSKRKRFAKDAMERFEDEGAILARMLNDTRYMSKIAREYMTSVAGPDDVWVIPGKMTAKFRYYWGLNSLLSDSGKKERTDHRHHSIDALVVALTSRSMIQQYHRAIKRTGDSRFLEKMPQPFENFVERTQSIVDNIIVSHRPDHGNAERAIRTGKAIGALHDETAYSIFEGDWNQKSSKEGQVWITVKKLLTDFKKKADLEKIKDRRLYEDILMFLNSNFDLEMKDALLKYSEETGVKRVKVVLEQRKKATLFGVRDKEGKVYKYYISGSNYCADIYAFPEKFKRELAGKWECEIIPLFAVHRHGFVPNWKQKYPMAKRIMRLQINDMIALDTEEGIKYFRVKFVSKEQVFLISHLFAGAKCYFKSYSAKQLQECNARKITVTITGRVKDRYVNK